MKGKKKKLKVFSQKLVPVKINSLKVFSMVKKAKCFFDGNKFNFSK